MWKDKLIEQGSNYADSTVKEIAEFYGTKVKNLEPREDKKILLLPP